MAPTPLTVFNAGFEEGTNTGWTMTDDNGNAGIIVRLFGGGTQRTGSFCARISTSTGNINGSPLITECESDLFSLGAALVGDTFTVGMFARPDDANSDRDVRIGLSFHDAGGAIIGSKVYGPWTNPYQINGNSIGTYVEITHADFVPVGATQARIHWGMRKSTSGFGGPLNRVDDFYAQYETVVAAIPGFATSVNFQVQYNEAGESRVSKNALSVLYNQADATSDVTAVYIQVLRTAAGSVIPIQMLIPVGWNPALPIPPDLTNPN